PPPREGGVRGSATYGPEIAGGSRDFRKEARGGGHLCARGSAIYAATSQGGGVKGIATSCPWSRFVLPQQVSKLSLACTSHHSPVAPDPTTGSAFPARGCIAGAL